MESERKQNQGTQESTHYLLFKLGGELYGCPLLQVREVVKVLEIKALPQNSKNLKGVVNLRGQVISVMDLRQRLGISKMDQQEDLLFVVESNLARLGVLVDSAESVVEFSANDIEMPLDVSPRTSGKFFMGVAKFKDKIISLLDLDALVSELVSNFDIGRETHE